MKILVIIGSGRKNGNTQKACTIFCEELAQLAAAAETALEIETVSLGATNISPCRGCRTCFDHGEERCPLKDDLPGLREKMRAADGLLIASPVYVDDVSGLVKNWIDRIAHACHRPEFAGRCAFLLATTGGSPTGHAMRTLTVALSTWGFHITGQLGLKTGARMNDKEMRSFHTRALAKSARCFFKAINERQYNRPSFLSLMMFRIQQMSWKSTDPNTVDYRYWQEKGWLEKRAQFFFPHQGSPLKTFLARGTGTLLARFFR
jgi:multimeric flavodoxin WrbA